MNHWLESIDIWHEYT